MTLYRPSIPSPSWKKLCTAAHTVNPDRQGIDTSNQALVFKTSKPSTSTFKMYFSFLALFPLLPFTYGQYGAPDATSSSGTASTSSASSSTPSNVHIVSVGSNGLTFSPNSMTVPVGDQVEFHFFPPEHSVAQSSFSTPCAPPSNGTAFWSGFIQTSSSSNVCHFSAENVLLLHNYQADLF